MLKWGILSIVAAIAVTLGAIARADGHSFGTYVMVGGGLLIIGAAAWTLIRRRALGGPRRP